MSKEKTPDNKLALVSEDELSLVEDNFLNKNQLQFILRRTPEHYIKTRTTKSGTWRYVTGGYIKKCLNLMFGWDWNFEIISEEIRFNQVIVKGKLTLSSGEHQIVKMQYGNKEIEYKSGTQDPVDIGFDFKAAATDCLKKCAAEIGIAADIYNAEDFKEIKIADNKTDFDEVKELYEKKKNLISPDDQIHCERILDNKETASYQGLKQKLEKA